MDVDLFELRKRLGRLIEEARDLRQMARAQSVTIRRRRELVPRSGGEEGGRFNLNYENDVADPVRGEAEQELSR